jgi:hypothetical protein
MTMSDQHTAFEELPPAVDTPIGEGRILWEASFLVTKPDGDTQSSKVKAVLHQDKASDIRLKQEQRGHLMCGMLVDAAGMVYGISAVYVGGLPEIPDGDVAASSQVDVARARLIDLASAWRRTGLQMQTEYFDTARAVVYAECAKQLDEIVVQLLASSEETEPEVEDGW